MKIEITYDGSKKSITLTAAEVAVLEHELVDPREWVFGATRGKLPKLRKRLVAAEAARLKADPEITTMPADDDGLVASGLAKPGYQKRKDIEAARLAAEAE